MSDAVFKAFLTLAMIGTFAAIMWDFWGPK